MREKIKRYLPCILLVVVTAMIGFPLFKSKLLNGHDGVFQLFRCYTTGVAIKDGQLIPMVNPDMIGGFGYATNMFYGGLVTYVVTLLSMIFPLGFSINLVILLTIFLSGLFTYQFVKDMTGSKKASMVAAIIYMTSPYLLMDIYIRMALGEILSFAFLPLLFRGLYNIINGNGKKWYLLTIGTVLLFLSHTVSTLMAAFFAFLYLILNIKKVFQKTIIKKLAISLIFALLISLVTILPLLEVKLKSDYMVFDSTYMRTTGEKMEARAVHLLAENPTETTFITIGSLIVSVLLICFLFSHKQEKSYVHFVVLTLCALLLTLSFIPWSKLPAIFSTIQFPWRFLQLSSFFMALSLALFYFKIESKKVSKYLLFGLAICLLVAFPFVKMGVKNPGIDNGLIHSNRLKKRGDIVRSTGSASAEYLPRNALYNYEYLKDHPLEPVILNGNGEISKIEKKGTHLSFDLKVNQKSIIELPFIYYPGYVVKTENKTLKTFETENGLVGVRVEKGNYHIRSHYVGSTLMIISYFVSIISFITFLIVLWKGGKKNEINK